MKNLIFTFILTSAFFISVFSADYQYAEVKVSGSEDIRFLQQNNIDIDRTSFGMKGKPLNGKVTVYITQEQFSLLEENNYELKWTPLSISKDGYRYNEAIGDSMLIWQNRYPDICKRLQIGTSVQGRPMWALKITDSLDIEEAEPEVKFVGTIHGDEVTGLEMQMFMIENILKGYAAENDTMKFIVDNTELYVMPLMNPDGMANNSRYNANGYDMNRNFPEGTHYDTDSVNAVSLPEIQAMIDWTKEQNFIMSTNFHGGALVANYIYDIDFGIPNFSYAACPDDPHVTWLAYNYSVLNSPMYNGPFDEGITNGSVWYQITGGMQDWNYRYHNCLDITLEISSTKWPAYSYIPGFWEDNRESMFWYLSAVHKGIYGRVTDADTGEPLLASIEIEGIDKIYYTDTDHGDYYRILKPGTFNVTVSSVDHYQQTFYGIEVTDNTGKFKEATELNVELLSCVGIEGGDRTVPETVVLHQNYPNPFNPSTMISFTTDMDQHLKLSVYDSKGNAVNNIAEGNFSKGTHTFDFNAEGLSSGTYYYSVSGIGGQEISKKMLMLK
jgi:hypothetical protein